MPSYSAPSMPHPGPHGTVLDAPTVTLGSVAAPSLLADACDRAQVNDRLATIETALNTLANRVNSLIVELREHGVVE